MSIRRKNIKLDKEARFLHENLTFYSKNGKYLDERNLRQAVINYYGLPINNEYGAIITSPYIVAMAVQDNINKNREYIMDMGISFLKSDEEKITSKYIQPKYNFIRIRSIFNETFVFIPRRECIHKDMAYIFIDDSPFLITKATDKDEIDKLEFGDLQTNELKLLTALTFLSRDSFGIFHIVIKQGTFSIPIDLIGSSDDFSVKEIEKVKLIIKLISKLKNNRKMIEFRNHGSNYHEDDHLLVSRIKLFLDNYENHNEVLKRSTYLLCKANMLAYDNSQLFLEEAYTFLTIAIEGIVKLIAIREFGKFDKAQMFEFIRKNFNNGIYITESLQTIYEARIELVHPINDYDISWNKHITYDLFFEDMDIARQLLYYFVTGRKLKIYTN